MLAHQFCLLLTPSKISLSHMHQSGYTATNKEDLIPRVFSKFSSFTKLRSGRFIHMEDTNQCKKVDGEKKWDFSVASVESGVNIYKTTTNVRGLIRSLDSGFDFLSSVKRL